MIGYFGEIGFPQYRHLPRRKIHPNTGMLSRQASRCSHLGHREGGVISDSSRGNRQTTTFRKLPMHAPRAKKKQMKMRCWGFKLDRGIYLNHEGTKTRRVSLTSLPNRNSAACSFPILITYSLGHPFRKWAGNPNSLFVSSCLRGSIHLLRSIHLLLRLYQ